MKNPAEMTTDELQPYASEFMRRQNLGRANKPQTLRPCPKGCGQMLGARALRAHIPRCVGALEPTATSAMPATRKTAPAIPSSSQA